MDVEADVALRSEGRLSRVQADANANRAAAEQPLRLDGGGRSIPGTCERDEEGVALRVDLDAAVRRERVPEQVAMPRKRVGVGVAELAEKSRRALDVGEQQGDGAGGQRGHQSR
ncbi:MAG TPA: hypothetical protein VGJ25_11280 [Gaiellaceae bacterium]